MVPPNYRVVRRRGRRATTLARAAAYYGGYASRRVVDAVAKAAYSKVKKEFFESKESPHKPRKRKKPGASIVRMDGVTGGKYLVGRSRRRRRRKKSLKQKVAEVRKMIPPKSYKTFRDFRTMSVKAGSNSLTPSTNNHAIYDISCFGPSDYEGYISNLTKVDDNTTADYSLSNTAVKMNLFYKLTCKNNMTSNAILKYSFLLCKDDDQENPLDDLLEELADRGYTGLPTTAGPTAATVTKSFVPYRTAFGATSPYHVPVFSGVNLRTKWKVLGVKSVRIGPGDTIDMVYKRNNFMYKPERLDNENFSNLKGYSVRLMISIHGDIAHDSTNHLLIGRGDAQLDCEECKIAKLQYSNPKALKEVEYTDTLTDENFTTAVHADNRQSAIEQDQN